MGPSYSPHFRLYFHHFRPFTQTSSLIHFKPFLGIRLQRSFPSILENIYDRNKFQFRYTNTQRTEASYKAFVEGLFGPNAHEHINVQPPPSNDTLLRVSALLCNFLFKITFTYPFHFDMCSHTTVVGDQMEKKTDRNIKDS